MSISTLESLMRIVLAKVLVESRDFKLYNSLFFIDQTLEFWYSRKNQFLKKKIYENLTPKRQWKPKQLFADLGRVFWMH